MVKTPTLLRALCMGAALSLTTGLASGQDADTRSAEYSALLSQIADKKLSVMQQEVFLAHQDAEMEFLREQIEAAGETTGDIDGILVKMIAQIERTVTADLPFQREMRLSRINKLKNDLDDETLPIGDKYRLALSALGTEVNYGISVEDYVGERPLNQGETVTMRMALADLDDEGNPKLDANGNPLAERPEEGTFLRYGRVALVYMDDRMVSARRWDAPTQTWVDLAGAELLDVRKAVRVARGEVAPSVVMAPTHRMP